MAEAELTDGEFEGRATEDTAPNPLLEISNEMVRIYKEQFGRGPTKVRTNYAGPDTLVCLLEHTFTPPSATSRPWASISGCETYACSFSTQKPRGSPSRSRGSPAGA
jgi:Na+-translocating membrane potential-generating system (MpsC)